MTGEKMEMEVGIDIGELKQAIAPAPVYAKQAIDPYFEEALGEFLSPEQLESMPPRHFMRVRATFELVPLDEEI